MAKAKIQVVYDKKTGKHEILFDMEQDTLDLRLHNREHEQLVRAMVGEDATIESVREKAPDSPPKTPEQEGPSKRDIKQGT